MKSMTSLTLKERADVPCTDAALTHELTNGHLEEEHWHAAKQHAQEVRDEKGSCKPAVNRHYCGYKDVLFTRDVVNPRCRRPHHTPPFDLT